MTRVPARQQHSARVVIPARPSMSLGSRRFHCRSSFRSRAEFAHRNNLFRKRFETRIAAEWVEQRVNSDKSYVRARAILITLFKLTERLLFVAQSKINKGKAVGGDISLLG